MHAGRQVNLYKIMVYNIVSYIYLDRWTVQKIEVYRFLFSVF